MTLARTFDRNNIDDQQPKPVSRALRVSKLFFFCSKPPITVNLTLMHKGSVTRTEKGSARRLSANFSSKLPLFVFPCTLFVVNNGFE